MPIGIGVKLTFLNTILALVLASATLTGGTVPGLQQQSNVTWTNAASWFGGLSGVEISSDGKMLSAVSDRGRFIEAEMIRENGVLIDLRIVHSVALRNEKGKILNRPFTDSEGLAIAPEGNAFVSFEGQHRVVQLDRANGITTTLSTALGIRFAEENAGLEALAMRSDGVLFALPEATADGTLPLLKFTNEEWSVDTHLPAEGPFLPVGADFDDQDRLYLLERTLTPLGFRSQIRRFTFRASGMEIETLLVTHPARYDNLEGISVWQDASSRTMLTLISDDNFLPFQRSQIVEFAVPD